jgi:hypothetical protein
MGAAEIATIVVGLLKVGADAWRAYQAEGVEAALKLLDDGLREGRVAVATMKDRLAENNREALAALAAKFPDEAVTGEYNTVLRAALSLDPNERAALAAAIVDSDADLGASER